MNMIIYLMRDIRPEGSNGFGSLQDRSNRSKFTDQEITGGPRACALEPTANGGRTKVRSRQRTALAFRSTSTMEACGSAVGGALLPTQHNVQQAPFAF